MAWNFSQWSRRSSTFRTMPARSLVLFLSAVFVLFAGVGVVTDLFNLERSDGVRLTLSILSAAAFSTGWAYLASTARWRWMFGLGCVQFAYYSLLANLMPGHSHALSLQDMHRAVAWHGVLLLASISIAYALFLAFFGAEGRRFFAAHTEIELASTIQRDLVPPLELTLPSLEIYGFSIPSGKVGGDLLDVIHHSGKCLAYVADVAGHGVKAGVLMSMIKASVRTRFAASSPCADGFLDDLNRILSPMTDAQSYATMAFLIFEPGQRTAFSLAAHSPIFHFRQSTQTVEQLSVSNFPIAMFPSATFQTSHAEVLCGDIVAIVTDGLTEIFNRHDQELGYSYIENALRGMAARPLPDIAAALIETGTRFGPATDDRTLLLIRATA